MAKKVAKKKVKAPKKESKKESAEEELEEDFLGEEGDDAEEELDAEEISDEEELPDLEEDEEEEAPAPAKKVKSPAIDEGETVQSKARKKEAARPKGPVPVKEEWYEFKRGNTYDPKKGLKLIRYRRRADGAISDYIGWEKKIPKSFIKKIRAEGKLKE